MYSCYIKYLKSKGVAPKEFNAKKPFVKKIAIDKYDYYSPDDVKKFTLGTLEEILGVERVMKIDISSNKNEQKETKYELKIDDNMASYLDCIFKKDAFSGGNREREILHYIISFYQDVQSIADSFRNPSAHTSMMKYHRAEVCGNHIIKVKKLLKHFVDKIDMEFINQL